MGVAGDLSGYSDFELKLLVEDLLEQLDLAATARRRDVIIAQLADIRDEMHGRAG